MMANLPLDTLFAVICSHLYIVCNENAVIEIVLFLGGNASKHISWMKLCVEDVTIIFSNNCQQEHNILWVDFQCTKAMYFKVPHGCSIPCTGYITTDIAYVLLHLISLLTH